MDRVVLLGLLLAACVGLAVCQPKPDSSSSRSEESSEEGLVRCPRVLCEMACEHGLQTDANGCPVCACQLDPCKNYTCDQGKVCFPEPAPHCEDCPEPKCGEDCPFGHMVDEQNCKTCRCKLHPCDGHRCSDGQRCQAFHDCELGTLCDMTPKCISHIPVPEQPPNPACPIPMCMTSCEFGMKRNSHGCETCECNEKPCQSTTCPEGTVCKPRITKCDRPECPIEAGCVAPPLCAFMRDHGNRPSGHVVECDESGSFKPRQCHEPSSSCWCVDDRGEEIDGTRASVKQEEDKPTCVYNRTVKVHVSFLMRHDFERVTEHLGRLKTVVHEHVSQWLMVDKEFIVQLRVEPHTHITHMLVVEFDVIRYKEVDLPSAVHVMRDRMHRGGCHVHYGPHRLQPDPHTLRYHHEFEPETAGRPIREHHGLWYRVCRNKLPVAMACAAGLVLLLGVVTLLCVLKKKHQRTKRLMAAADRGEAYKKNLAFTNQLYDHASMIDADSDIRKVKLEFIPEEKTPLPQ